VIDLARNERVVADDLTVGVDCDVGACHVPASRLSGVCVKPAFERVIAASNGPESVPRAIERLDPDRLDHWFGTEGLSASQRSRCSKRSG
jgi:hypothetical protein